MLSILFALNGVFNNGGTEAVVLNIYNNTDKKQFHKNFLEEYNTKFQNKNQYFTELSWQEDEVRKAISLRRLDEDDSKISRMEK